MAALVGRILQIIGMVILPVGLYYGFVRGDVRFEVQLLAIGGFLFILGWIIAKQPGT